MSKIFKKSALGLAILSLAGVTSATAFNGFFGGLEASYLQGRNDDLNYVNVLPLIDTASNSATSIPLNNHEYGWRLFGGMKFAGKQDVTFSYLRFHTNNSGFIENPPNLPGNDFPGASIPRWLFETSYVNIHSHVTFDLDDYYLMLGHTVNINAWNIRAAAGVDFVRLDSDMTVAANLFGEPLIAPLGYTAKSGLRGVGPRLELDAAYNFPFGINVFADANGALLISHRNISLNTLNRLGSVGPFQPSFGFSQRFPIVPKVGLKMGIGFSQTFGQVSEGAAPVGTTMSAQIGWQVESYIHAIERPNPSRATFNVDLAQIPSVTNDQTTVSNYDYQGPFLTLTIGTDWL